MMRTTGLYTNGIGVIYPNKGVCAMEKYKDVYFLPIKRASQLAEAHKDEPDWDIWKDERANVLGQTYKVLKAHEEKSDYEKAV